MVVLALSLPLLAHLLYRTWAAFNLEYWVDRNAVTVRWANTRQMIPMPAIRRIIDDGYFGADRRGRCAVGPCPICGSQPRTDRMKLNLCATRPAEECVLLETDSGLYALSPADPQQFVATVQERFGMGPTQRLHPHRVRRSPVGRVLPADRLGTGSLVGGAVGVLILFGVVMISFPNLPDVLTVRYNSAGLPEEIRAKTALFRLPVIGLLAWLINGVAGLVLMARQQRTGAYMLWGGALTVADRVAAGAGQSDRLTHLRCCVARIICGRSASKRCF